MNPFAPQSNQGSLLKKPTLLSALFGPTSLLLLFLAGCSGPPAPGPASAAVPPANKTKATPKPDPFAAVQKGMTAAEVRSLVGEPKEIKPFKAGDLKSEVWVYQHTIAERTRQVEVGTQDVPVVDSLTGRAGTAKESVMGLEFVTVSETVELLMIEGQVIEIKRKPRLDRTIN